MENSPRVQAAAIKALDEMMSMSKDELQKAFDKLKSTDVSDSLKDLGYFDKKEASDE